MMIETPRLILRPYQDDEVEFFIKLCQDPEVMQYIGNGKPKTRSEAEELFQRLTRHQRFCLAICKETGKWIGHAGIVEQEVDQVREWEIGYWIDKPFWGQGYATEAAMAIRDEGFGKLSLKRLICLIQPKNLASIRVAKKLGMKWEKDTVYRKIPVRVYALGRETWISPKTENPL